MTSSRKTWPAYAAAIGLDLALTLVLGTAYPAAGWAPIVSLAAGAAVWRGLVARRDAAPGRPWAGVLRAAVLAVLAVALRRVVTLTGTDAAIPPSWGEQLAGLSASWLVLWAGNLAASGHGVEVAGRRLGPAEALLLGVATYLALLRLAMMGNMELLHEESYYWIYAKHPALSYLDHPPMVAWLIWAGIHGLGDSELGVRAGAFLAWMATAGFSAGLAYRLAGRSAAIFSVAFVAAAPFFLTTGLIMTPDAPLTAAWAGSLFFLERALLGRKGWGWLGAGVCVGVGMLSKYTIALLGPATIIFALADARSRRWFVRPEPYVSLAIALLCFSPVLLWNAQNDWASFAFQGSRRLEEENEFMLHRLVLSMLVLLTPVGLGAGIRALWGSRPGPEKDRAGDRRVGLFVRAYTLAPLLVFVAFSLGHAPKLNWTGPLWLAALPLMGAAWAGLGGGGPRATGDGWGRTWNATFVALALVYAVAADGLSTEWAGLIQRDKVFLPVGWSELGRAVGRIEEAMELSTGEEPLVIGLDKNRISSQLAFYDCDEDGARNAGGRHLFDRDALMFEYWMPASRAMGRNAILVAAGDDPEDLTDDDVEETFERMGPVEAVEIRHGKLEVGRFYIRIGYAYRGESWNGPWTSRVPPVSDETSPVNPSGIFGFALREGDVRMKDNGKAPKRVARQEASKPGVADAAAGAIARL